MRFIKSLVFICFVFFNSQLIFSQGLKYFDSLNQAIEPLPKKEQIKIITTVPFDKIENDIKTYEKLVNKAIRFSNDINDSLLLADSYVSKATVTNAEENIKLFLDAIRIYEQLKVPEKAGEVYTRLGWQLKRRDYDKAINYYRKGIKRLEEHSGNIRIDAVYDNYGVMLGMRQKWDSALYYHEKSLKRKKQLNDSVGIPFGFSHVANVFLKQEKYNIALKYLDSSLVIRKKRQDIYGITDTYLYYGDLYFLKQDYIKAQDYFKKAYDLALKHHYFPLKKYASEYLYKTNDSLGDYKNALKYNLIFNSLKDSILNVETNSKISELEIQFQTENKEKEILSQRADLAEKELHINQKNTQLIGLSILALVLSIFGYLIYNQQKLKNKQLQKESELKQAIIKIETQNRLQEQRLQISRDLHDNIGSQLTFIISSLDNLKYGFKLPEKLNEKLQSIGAFTSSTIYELRDTIWAMNKNEITLDDLHARISNYIKKADTASHTTNFEFKTEGIKENIKFSSVEGMNIYRIIQEAINNAIKYANPSNIKVVIMEVDNNLKIQIIDDGDGFGLDVIDYGNGLNNMQKRATEIGADFNLESKINTGTTISIIKYLNT